MPVKLYVVKQFGRSPWKPLNWKQSVVASPLLPEKEMETLGHSQELLLLLPNFTAHPALTAMQAVIFADIKPNACGTLHRSKVLSRVPDMLKNTSTCKDSFCGAHHVTGAVCLSACRYCSSLRTHGHLNT